MQRLPLQVTGWSGRHPSWSQRDQEDGCPSLTHHPLYKLVGNLATTVMLQLCVRLLCAQLCSGGEMLFKVAFVLLLLWLLGIAGVYPAGAFLHAVLLVGLMLLLMAFVKARDAATRRAVGGDPREPR